MINIHAQFAALASIASSQPTATTPAGADGKPTAADIATAQTALDAVANAYATLNS